MTAVLVVQEEADEFRPEPEPEEVEGACEVTLDQKNHRLWPSNAREGYQGIVESRH